jgi:hypothetical protein
MAKTDLKSNLTPPVTSGIFNVTNTSDWTKRCNGSMHEFTLEFHDHHKLNQENQTPIGKIIIQAIMLPISRLCPIVFIHLI